MCGPLLITTWLLWWVWHIGEYSVLPEMKHTHTAPRYAWSSVFGVLLVAAANLSTYWGSFAESQMWQTLLFYIVCPIFMLVINCLGVAVSWKAVPGWSRLIACSIMDG